MFNQLSKLLKVSFSQSKFIVRRDPYQSLQILLESKSTQQQLKAQIQSHQKTQKAKNTNAIWIFLNSQNLSHAEILVNQFGYRIHHGQNNRIALYKWLSKKSDLVPLYSNFYVSCGSVVIHNDRILMVQENNGPRKGLFGIPGGRADVGQFLHQTAERQLFEETGVVAKFKHFLYFRQMENTVFGANDLYFVCLMQADESSIQKLKLCDRQLASFEWVHLSELDKFVNSKSVGTQKQVGNYICELFKKGYKFQTSEAESFPNIQSANIFTRGFDKVHRKFMEYRLINPNSVKNEQKII